MNIWQSLDERRGCVGSVIGYSGTSITMMFGEEEMYSGGAVQGKGREFGRPEDTEQ